MRTIESFFPPLEGSPTPTRQRNEFGSFGLDVTA